MRGTRYSGGPSGDHAAVVSLTDPINREAPFPSHMERSRGQMSPARQHVWQNGGHVRQGGQNDIGADKCVEGRCGAHLDAAQNGTGDADYDRCVERVMQAVVDPADDAAERRGLVTAQGPEHATGRDVAGDAARYAGKEDDDQKAKSSTPAVGGLVIDLGQGEWQRTRKDGVQVVHRVEEGDQVGRGPVPCQGRQLTCAIPAE